MCLNMFRSVESIAHNVLIMLYWTFFGEQGSLLLWMEWISNFIPHSIVVLQREIDETVSNPRNYHNFQDIIIYDWEYISLFPLLLTFPEYDIYLIA